MSLPRAPVDVLAIEDLWLSVGDHAPVLRGVGLRIGAGEVHGLVGESGAGKSMIGRSVLGLLPRRAVVRAGHVRYGRTDLLRLDGADRRRLLGREISVIPQDPMMSLNPVKRIRTQMVDLLHHRIGLDRNDARARAIALLDEVMIRDPARVAELYPHELSGGMRQRVLIALAFAGEPRLIIADEPTTALDVTVQWGILRLLRDMQIRHGAAVMFITHDLGIVAKICRTMSVLHAGRVLEQGMTADLLANPRHPYTKALLASTPRVDRPTDVLQPIPRDLLDALWGEAQATTLTRS
jgi:peptide/nickel transport system ATP-binding protein